MTATSKRSTKTRSAKSTAKSTDRAKIDDGPAVSAESIHPPPVEVAPKEVDPGTEIPPRWIVDDRCAGEVVKAPTKPRTSEPRTSGENGVQKRVKKPHKTFMLHDPVTYVALGRYKAADHRYAALKCASKGFERILLRQTNTKEVREFSGTIVVLDVPKIVKRGDREIAYTKRPSVKHVNTFVFPGDKILPTDLEDSAAEERVSEN